jgi:3-mercaptopyruvate sulfurtransferase SseA
VAQHFLDKGHDKIFIIQGGWSAWQNAGYPVENK